MTKMFAIRPEFVDRIPKVLEEGVFYISLKFGTAAHNCCCGCGTKIVTPLKAGRWQLEQHNGRISISPSIGNWSSGCQSHYIISNNQILWTGAFSASQIEANRVADRIVRERAHAERTWQEAGFWMRVWMKAKAIWAAFIRGS